MDHRFDASWERQLSAAPVPPMDVHDRVMEAVGKMRRTAGRKPSMSARHRAWLLPALVIALLVGSGFLYLDSVLLSNDAGETVLTIHRYDDDHAASPVTAEEWEYYSSLVQPGETIFVYKTDNNPQKIVSSYTRPAALQDYSQLRDKVNARFPLPGSVPEPFSFVEGLEIAAVPPAKDLLDDLLAEGERSGQTAIRMMPAAQEEIYGITLKLVYAGEEYAVSILDREHAETWYANLDRHTDFAVITIFGTEGYVAKVDGKQELFWKNGNGAGALFYHLSTTDLSEQGKGALLKLLEALAAEAGER